MKPRPTGRVDRADGGRTLRLSRTFRAPIEDVWAAVTEPDRLERWIGTWTGDPATGRVEFRMTAEGVAQGEDMEILECDPPRRLAVVAQAGVQRWRLELDLVEEGGVTTLSFAQPDLDPEDGSSVGPGWEYYLDRLVTAETGGDVGSVDFERDYYPAMRDHYRDQIG
jgi:uncharacterized protein YndB with AHSA1/START domain